MEVFLLKTFKRIKKEAPRRFKDLRNQIDELIIFLTDRVDSSNQSAAVGNSSSNSNNSSISESDGDKYFFPFQECCESRYPKLMEIGLDAIHYLIGK